MSELLNSTTLNNDKRLEDFFADTKKLADTEAKSGDSLTKTAIRLVREAASGVVDDVEQVKKLYNLHHDTIAKREAANPHRKVAQRKPMTKRAREQQQGKLIPYWKVGLVKSVIVVSDDQSAPHDYSGEAAMDHVQRLYKAMDVALPAYTAYGAAAVRLRVAAEANESVTDAELTQAMTDKDKAAKKVKTAKDHLTHCRDVIGKIMNGTMKGVEQDNAKPVCDAFAILDQYVTFLNLKVEHDAFLIRAAKVGYEVAKLEKTPRPLAGRKRSQKRG